MTQNEQLKIKAVERALFSKIQQARKQAKLELSDSKNVIILVFSGMEIVKQVVEGIKEKINGELKVEVGKEKAEEFDGVEIEDVAFTV